MRGRDLHSEAGWQVSPSAPACQHEHDRGEHSTIIHARPSASLRTNLMRRDQRFDQCPQLIRHQPPRQLINHEPRSCPQPNQDPNETRSKDMAQRLEAKAHKEGLTIDSSGSVSWDGEWVPDFLLSDEAERQKARKNQKRDELQREVDELL